MASPKAIRIALPCAAAAMATTLSSDITASASRMVRIAPHTWDFAAMPLPWDSTSGMTSLTPMYRSSSPPNTLR